MPLIDTVMPGDYYAHVPVKARLGENKTKVLNYLIETEYRIDRVDSNRLGSQQVYYVDTLKGEQFESIDALAKRQLERGDPEGLPFATVHQHQIT